MVDGSVSRFQNTTGNAPWRSRSLSDHTSRRYSSGYKGNLANRTYSKDLMAWGEQFHLPGRNLFSDKIGNTWLTNFKARTSKSAKSIIEGVHLFMHRVLEKIGSMGFSYRADNCTNCLTAVPLIMLLVAVSTACNISKDPVKAEAVLPVTFRNAVPDSGQTINTSIVRVDSAAVSNLPGGAGDLSWKQFFTDADLQRLVDTAIAKNYDMQLAVKNIEAARLIFRQSRWGYAPDVALQLAAGSSRPSDNSLNGLSASQFLGTTHIEDYNASIGISWEADIWGKIKNRKAAALASYLQSGEAKKAIQTNLVASVAQAYYNLLMLDAQLDVAARNIKLSDSTLRILRFQYNAGQVTALAVQQAEAQLNATTTLVPELQKNIVLQENALRVLSGELPRTINRSSLLTTAGMPDSLSAGIPAALLGRRPDIKAQELELAIANAQVGITNANMYPALRITASGGLNSFRASNWFNIPASLFGAVAGSLVQPVLQKKQLRTEYEIAKVRRDQSVIAFRQSVLNAVGEVSDALVEIEKLTTARQMVSERVALLQRATGNARQLFSSGMANYLEVITAQGSVLQSELELASLTRQKLAAQVELYRSLGGGWN